MKRFTRWTFAVVTLGAAGASVGVGIASAAPTTKPEYENTYEMYANVNAKGALGPNYDAVNVMVEPEDGPVYYVYFKHAISKCAAVVQPGAGGTPIVPGASSDVEPANDSPDAFQVTFSEPNDEFTKADPFMIIVTCKS